MNVPGNSVRAARRSASIPMAALSLREIWVPFRLLLPLFLVMLTSCKQAPEDARRELASLGVTWSVQNFIDSVENNDTVVVRLYLAAGMSPDSTSDFGWTALMHAALTSGSSELMQQLLDAGADVNAKDPAGMTALSIAAGQGHPRNVALLLKAGATVDAKDQDGWTALMYAAQVGNEEIVRSFIAAGAHVNLESKDGDTPLSLAQESENENVVKLLTESGASKLKEHPKLSL